MPELDRDTAREWIERWDRQQEESLPDREDRFTALIDAVEEGTGRRDPLVLDIGCGPGSLGVRLLARLPRATVIGIDADPALAGHVAERARRRVEAGHHVSESTLLATHVEALRAAGFAEVGTLWQRGDNRLLCGVLPADQDDEGILSQRPTA